MPFERYYARPVAIPLWEVVLETDGVNRPVRMDPMPEAEARAKAMQLTRESDRRRRSLREETALKAG